MTFNWTLPRRQSGLRGAISDMGAVMKRRTDLGNEYS